MFRNMNPITACCAAVLMLGLAACGDSKKMASDGDGMMPTMPTTPTPMPTPMPVDLSGLAMDARHVAGMATIPAGESRDIGEITFTCPAGDACSVNVTVADDGTATATSTGGAAMAANSAAYTARTTPMAVNLAGVARDARRVAGTEGIDAGETADIGEITFTCPAGGENCSVTVTVADDGSATAMSTGAVATAANSAGYTARKTRQAESKERAIGVEAGQTPDAGLGGSSVRATGNNEGAYNVDIERGSDGLTITVRVEGATDAADENFVKASDLTGAAGHMGQMQTRTMEADAEDNVMREVAVVYTDIDAPTATAFGMVHTLNVRVDGQTANEARPNDALNVEAANLEHVRADAFKAPAGTVGTPTLSFQHEVEDDSGTPQDESRDAAEIAGTYEGAMGTYKCNATSACSVTVNAMGVVSGVSNDNDWIFIPAAGATADVADDDYLHYGFWLKQTTDNEGEITYDEVETFAGSSVDASGSVARVTGTATYEGGAAGVYMMKKKFDSSTGNLVEASSGHFTARASLTATFGQRTENDIPPNLLDTLTGTIDQFALSGREANNWSVALQSDGDPNTDGIQPDEDGIHSGTAKGNKEGANGSFSATFHGPVLDSDNNPIQPHSVVGEFNADFTNGAVAGAFGARKK